jgi:aminomethyltransferase
MSQPLPLESFHQEHGARFADFAGWAMPTFYSSMIEEHKAVRQAVGLFDVSHMGELHVTGKDAEQFLNFLITNDLKRIGNGQALYSPVCHADGGTVDDWILYRIDAEQFFICINASNRQKDIEWIKSHIEGFACEVRDVSDAFGLLAVQGPKAAALVASLLESETTVNAIKKFCFRDIDFKGTLIRLSRTGYTGEDGFELYLPAGEMLGIAETLWDKGQAFGLRLCGLGARDSLRLEAKLPLYGHELDRDISPIEAGFGWAVRLQKQGDFIGRDALSEQKQGQLKRQMRHFFLDDRRIARQGAAVFAGESRVGMICSGTLSPILNKPIGSALIESAALPLKGQFSVEIRGQKIPLQFR